MQRSAVHLIVALITFKTGVFVWRLNPLRFRPAEPSEPLRVTFTPTRLTASANAPFEHYLVTVENVSSKTIRGILLDIRAVVAGMERTVRTLKGSHSRIPLLKGRTLNLVRRK